MQDLLDKILQRDSPLFFYVCFGASYPEVGGEQSFYLMTTL